MAIDFETLFGEEEYDPCAALKALRPALMKLRVGGNVARVRFRDRETEFLRGDVDGLAGLVAQLESDCARKQGRQSGRFAITAGYRRNSFG